MSQDDSQASQGPPPTPRSENRAPFRRRAAAVLRRMRGNHWLRLLAVAALIGLVLSPFAVEWGAYHLTHSITDDAFVETHLVNIAPQEVGGRLVRYLVQEHDVVAAGALLAEVDPIPYREQVALLQAKLGVAEAQLAAADTALEVLRSQTPLEIEVARKTLAAAQAEQARDEETLRFTTQDVEKAIHEAQALLDSSQAALVLAEIDHKRYTSLYKKEAATLQKSQEATRTHRAAAAEVKAAEARLGRALAARNKVGADRQAVQAAAHHTQKAEQGLALARTKLLRVKEAERQVEVARQQVGEARRALAVAQTKLGYTRIVAPFPGVVVKLYRHLGDYVPTGTPVLSMYNPELTYVTANLEESKLEGVAPGNPVRLDVVAFRKPFRGRVVWINKATGAQFALVPRNISSGEFTYVVQRVPVRILVEKDDRWPELRAGLSVTVAIEHGPGDPEWAKQAADAMRDLEATVKPFRD